MRINYHKQINVSALLHAPDDELKGYDLDGRQISHREMRLYLNSQLKLGKLYLPLGDCSNFDPAKGCMGHEVPEVLPVNVK